VDAGHGHPARKAPRSGRLDEAAGHDHGQSAGQSTGRDRTAQNARARQLDPKQRHGATGRTRANRLQGRYRVHQDTAAGAARARARAGIRKGGV
ncbi:MAG: hypothetical protein AVDCRST_MAG26-127, partial [uncultured Chloroflexia bacterium]